MALINCPDCNKKISDQGCSCINCGYPISKILSDQAQSSAPEEVQVQEEPSETKGSNTFTYKKFMVLFVLVVTIGVWYYNKNSGESNGSSDRETETLVSKSSTLSGYLKDLKTKILDN